MGSIVQKPGRRTVPLALVLLILGAALASAPRAAAKGGRSNPCHPGWGLIRPFDGSTLVSVTALSSEDMWAVGSEDNLQHWDGTSWTREGPADYSSSAELLQGVGMLSSSEAWAVGYGSATASGGPVALHYLGGAWRHVAPVQVEPQDRLYDVAGSSSDDVWAVGAQSNGVLIEHWDGASWTIVPGANPLGGQALKAIAIRNPSDVWAIGDRGLVERWDGITWNAFPIPTTADLYDVSVVSSANVWVTGYDPATRKAVAWRWNGKRWSAPHLPNILNAVLSSVSGSSPNNVTAVGFYGDPTLGQDVPLTEHWNGKAWSVVQTANPQPNNAAGYILNGVAVTDTTAFSVGQNVGGGNFIERSFPCLVSVSDTGTVPLKATVPQGSFVGWAFPRSNLANHTVTDHSGLGLFNSGDQGAGGGFFYQFTAAGSYPLIDMDTGTTSIVNVPPVASPTSGGPNTVFTLRWATTTATAPLAYDIQIKAPGASSFSDWRVGVSSSTSTFGSNDAAWVGPGTYAFRARVRSGSTQAAIGFSPTLSIVVSA